MAMQDFNVIINISMWTPSCIQHRFVNSASFNSISYEVYSENGLTLIKTIDRFIKNPVWEKHMHIDSEG
jgi:hypothetical protein